jgi:hypothetical protein
MRPAQLLNSSHCERSEGRSHAALPASAVAIPSVGGREFSFQLP